MVRFPTTLAMNLLPQPTGSNLPVLLHGKKTPLGFSSFTTYEGNAFTLVAEEDEDGLMREICIALDLKTGKREWSTHLGIMDYKAGGGNSGASDNKGGDGPRSTPSVLDGKVWAYDSDMSLYCLSAKNGKLIWKVNVLKEYDGINPRWENASSPLIVDDLVIIYGGGEGKSFLAFDKDSGRLKWKTGSELATHASNPNQNSWSGPGHFLLPVRPGIYPPKER